MELGTRGHRELAGRAVNVVMPWAAVHGIALGLPDGRYRVAQPPPTVEADLAHATLAGRYLAGLTVARRALAALGELDRAGDLVALPGTLDADLPPAPTALLLAAFDTALLGYRTRVPLVPAHRDRNVLPGGGMLRPVVLIDGVAAGTWNTGGPGRTVTIDWFDSPHDSAELDAEKAAVERFLG